VTYIDKGMYTHVYVLTIYYIVEDKSRYTNMLSYILTKIGIHTCVDYILIKVCIHTYMY